MIPIDVSRADATDGDVIGTQQSRLSERVDCSKYGNSGTAHP
jgi:hypothetical protein